MRRSISTAVLTALAAAAALAVPAQAAAPTAELQPDRLPRGADIAVPHIEDGDFVDGARRVELPGTVARVIGPVADGWLVATNNVDRKRNRRVVRVEADGAVVDGSATSTPRPWCWRPTAIPAFPESARSAPRSS